MAVIQDSNAKVYKGLASAFPLNLGTGLTAAPSTELVKGDLMVVWGANSVPNLGICTSTAAKTVKYVPAFATKTLGRTSAT